MLVKHYGKYRYGTVGKDSPALVGNSDYYSAGAKGFVSDTQLIDHLQKIYGSGPVVDGTGIQSIDGQQYTDAVLRAMAQAYFDDKLPVHSLYYAWTDKDDIEPTNIPADVEIGGKGLPATPFSPNPAPPGAHADGSVNVSPADQPDLGATVQGNTVILGTKQATIDGDTGTGLRNPAQDVRDIHDGVKTGNMSKGSHGGSVQ